MQPADPALNSPYEDRKQQILHAAAVIFAEKGFQRATMKEVAAAAGIVPGTIYLYFKNKHDLFMAIADLFFGQTITQTLEKSTALPPAEYFSSVARERFRFARENRRLIQALISEVWIDSELQRRFLEQVLGPLFSTGSRYLQAQIAAGAIRPYRPEIVLPAVAGSIIIMAALHGIEADHHLRDISADEIIEEMTRLFMLGLDASKAEGKE